MRKIKFLFLGICVSIGMSGCNNIEKLTSHREGDTVYGNSPRFIYTDTGNNKFFDIIKDKDTGVLYIFYRRGHKAGICPLYDSDGKVVVEKKKE